MPTNMPTPLAHRIVEDLTIAIVMIDDAPEIAKTKIRSTIRTLTRMYAATPKFQDARHPLDLTHMCSGKECACSYMLE